MASPIYLDHAATTPVRRAVLEAMLPFLGDRFGNPSSAHRWGREARAALDEARERVAHCLRAHADEVCFTSGGTEADNLAVIGSWRARRSEGRNAVLTTPIEHKAVLEAAHQVRREGGEERIVPMLPQGIVDVEAFAALADEQVAVCSVMWVNNEIGTIQPVPAVGSIAREAGIVVHTDAVQAFGRIDIDLRELPIDLLSISGHKIGAPKGVGAMYIRRGIVIEPLFHGGSQDRGRRPGTENVAAAIGLAVAAELTVREHGTECARLRTLRDRLEQMILERVPDAVIHGRGAPRAPHVLSVSVPGTDSEALLMALDLRGVACSAGSACQSGSITPSHVLAALGVPTDLASAAIRMSVGCMTTPECIDRVGELFPMLVERARGGATVRGA